MDTNTDARNVDTEGYVSVHERAQAQSTLVARTFFWLTIGLVLSGAVAAYVGTNDRLYDQFVDNTVLFWAVILSPLAIILLLGWGMERMSVATAVSLFVLFSFLEGLALSFIFQVPKDLRNGYQAAIRLALRPSRVSAGEVRRIR